MHAFMYNPNERFHAKDGFAIPCCWSLLHNSNSSNFISLGINMSQLFAKVFFCQLYEYDNQYETLNYVLQPVSFASRKWAHSWATCVGYHT